LFRSGRHAGRRSEPEDLEALRPYLELAREIQADVARVVADGTVDEYDLAEAVSRIPERERDKVVRAAFDRLPAEEQWAIIERVYGDTEIRRYLEEQRAERLAVAGRAARLSARLRTARAEQRLDTVVVEAGERLVLGLFREDGVGAAVARGQRSSGCVRRLVLRAYEPGRFRVIEDVFDPSGDYFVTAAYDRRAWEAERLDSHAAVRVGSRRDDPDNTFEPALYPGARLDVEVAGTVTEGHLHLGFAVLDGTDVFIDD
jgi:hypothetical protein